MNINSEKVTLWKEKLASENLTLLKYFDEFVEFLRKRNFKIFSFGKRENKIIFENHKGERKLLSFEVHNEIPKNITKA